MIQYFFYQKNPTAHYVYIDMLVDNVTTDALQLQLPAWRPGRYELGNFAKNVKRVDAFDQEGRVLEYTKLSKDLWEVNTKGCTAVKITYSYYAAELNAGACYADATQIYMNPVHCCLYVVGRTEEPHQVELKMPDNFKIASSLQQQGSRLMAADYEELVDSPFIASAGIKTGSYAVNGITFFLHFNGECQPDFEMMEKHFTAFTQKQLEFWGDCPASEYHFLFQVLPFKFYHGVEHKKSTVIAIGPGYAINSGATYEDILGVSCHELFHTWNIKTIRPVEMMPYDYTRENYARTGYVYEGFTTYYGDKLLLSSGVFSVRQYLDTLQERLTKHFDNFGRYNLSVAASSWETWLDGYVPGAPYRKTNIYDEGNLIAFMLDVKILRATHYKKRLRDVCVLLYERFGKKQTGYSETDVMQLANEVSGTDLSAFFKDHVYTPGDFEAPLKECFDELGIVFEKKASPFSCEQLFGFKVAEGPQYSKVSLVAPHSPAWKSGLFAGDEILAVNGITLRANFHHWMSYFLNNGELILTVSSNDRLKAIALQKDKKGNTWFFHPALSVAEGPNPAFDAWRVL